MGKKSYQNYGKTFRKPKRPFEKERLDGEMKIIGEYGLKNKREVWRVQYALAKIRTAARTLLTQEERSETRIFQGEALLRRMVRLGLLLEKLDFVLGLTTAKIMERRLQTKVFKLGLAKSIHHARTLIRQRHIRVGKQICDIPSFLVRLDSEKHIDFALTSPFGGGRPGRVRRKMMASKGPVGTLNQSDAEAAAGVLDRSETTEKTSSFAQLELSCLCDCTFSDRPIPNTESLSAEKWKLSLVKDCIGFELERLLSPGRMVKTSYFKPRLSASGSTKQLGEPGEEGARLFRRDPCARECDFNSSWCILHPPLTPPPAFTAPKFNELIIYELHIGSFVSEADERRAFAATTEKLEHIASLGFNCIQFMPTAEFGGIWGYNSRQLLAAHGPWGSAADMHAMVQRAHSLGMAVLFDVVLNHGSSKMNVLWNWDGFGPDNCGGIYFEGEKDTPWGKRFAFHKAEVQDYLKQSCRTCIEEYGVDGLRFDSVHNMPWWLLQQLTFEIKAHYPDKILIAEITPENPKVLHDAGP
eukprot:s8_g28.t1